MKIYLTALLLLIIVWPLSAQNKHNNVPVQVSKGIHSIVLLIDFGTHQVPFTFHASDKNTFASALYIRNGSETITAPRTSFVNDTAIYTMPVFDSYLKLWGKAKNLTGLYYPPVGKTAPQPIPVRLSPNTTLFRNTKAATVPLQPRYRVQFVKEKGEPTEAVGLFLAEQGHAHGTFETATGDYRYLHGIQNGDSLYLTTFDGSHAYLFRLHIKGDSLTGHFFSGKGKPQLVRGKADADARLPDAFSLAQPLTNETIDFGFADTTGQMIKLSDPRFAGKAVVVQILGTWCPNCMDETAFLANFYPTRPAGVEVLGLAFERRPDPEFIKARLRSTARRFKPGYQIVYAGGASTAEAKAALPFVSEFRAFPTTLFFDRQHRLRHIHTGYSGPATGASHQAFKKEFEEKVRGLVE